ncbi:MAG: hypothetical protein AMJ90_00150 [candidate division Zixibacteria bacterium SM23_73_2]|nr:MAG: hypothetical protein AMJ90_00150 [candidate division Zixibacteria bacterium SM23_73_2]
MKKSFLVFLILFFGVFPGLSYAQFLGQLNTAKTFEPGEFNLGAYLGVYEEAISTFGQFRLGISNHFDMGVKVGVLDFQSTGERDEVGIIVGGDLKYNLLNTEVNDPFDLSLGLSWEHADVKNPTRFAGGVNMIISKGFVMESGNLLSPYGRLNIRAERKTFKLSGKERTDTDLEVGATVGAVLQAREGWHFVGEFQMDEHYGFLLGLSYHIY